MPENNIIASDKFRAVAHGQAVVEARHVTEKECRVLSVEARPTVAVSEVFTGEARYTGKVRFDFVLSTPTGVECAAAVADFSDKLASPDIAVGCDVILVPTVVNAEAAAEGGAVKLVAVIDTDAFAAERTSCTCIGEGGDGIYTDSREIEYSCVTHASDAVYVNDAVEAVKLDSVLCADARAVITHAECADGEVKLTGTVYSSAVVRGADGTVSELKSKTPFAKSMVVPDAKEGGTVWAFVAVADCAATLIADDDKGRVETAVTLSVDATVFESKKTVAACDVFCADNEIEAVTREICATSVEPMQTVSDIVDGQIKLDAAKPAADTVLCVTGLSVTLTGVSAENGRVTAEGAVGGDIVYHNAEKNVADSVPFKLPFSIPLAVRSEAEDIRATAVVTDVNVRIRRESVFDIKIEVAFSLVGSSTRCVSVVESVTVGEPIPRPDATVIVHIAKSGETLWQAAKALCCSPERVTEQNAATAPYSGGERLVNFCEK